LQSEKSNLQKNTVYQLEPASRPEATMNPVDLAFTPALEQARLIRHKEISPLELVQVYLDRIQRLNPQLGSYWVVAAEQAIDDAKTKTEVLATAHPEGLPPFFGIPTSIKDLTPVEGMPCSYGVKVLRDQVPRQDAEVVRRMRDAGFILLGKTATSTLGSTPYTEPKGFPPARNPWNLNYTPGGSSGGAAAAVAAGLCAIAQGSDGGGSIRGPAGCCNLVGIKPARGRVSHAPGGDVLSGLATHGPIARTVADAAALLDVMAGQVLGDPYSLPDPPHSFLEATRKPIKGLKIGYATFLPPMGAIDPTCEEAVMTTVQLLEDLGHYPELVALDFNELLEPLAAVWQAGVDMGVPWFLLDKLNRYLLKRSRKNSGGVYLRAVTKMQTIARRIIESLHHVDVLVLPVFMHPTIRVGEWARLRPAQMFHKIAYWVTPCPPFNATGQPAIALPAGFTPEELPIGIQLIGRPADEVTIIALAAQIETARPWLEHRPSFAI
jgi:amidase